MVSIATMTLPRLMISSVVVALAGAAAERREHEEAGEQAGGQSLQAQSCHVSVLPSSLAQLLAGRRHGSAPHPWCTGQAPAAAAGAACRGPPAARKRRLTQFISVPSVR